MSTALKRTVYDELVDLPEHLVGEILGGELVVSPRPASMHALAAWELSHELDGPFGRVRGPGGWRFLLEPELHLGDDVLVPDIAGWRRERMPVMPRVAAFELAPDWVCEILSPSTARVDRVRKPAIYARHGVGHLWLLDPDVGTLEVWRNQAGVWMVVGTFDGTTPIHAEPFEGLALDLRRLCSDEPPGP